jgi:glycolate oxidase FAD binding subunit
VSSTVATSSVEQTITEWQQIIRTSDRIHVRGHQSKTAMHGVPTATHVIDTQQLSGITSYDPQEFVVSVLAGTPVAELQASLLDKGQYLPFDPLLANRGATIGGTVAANANGPGRFRFGGVRDFLIGARFIDGSGNDLRTGGKVVKNAAGFDYPKLLVGSRGQLGLLCELTFKVFPRPQSFATLECSFPSLDQAIDAMTRLANGPYDIEAIDLVPSQASNFTLAIRLGGLADAISRRVERLAQVVPGAASVERDRERDYWDRVNNFEWAAPLGEWSVLKIPITVDRISDLEQCLAPFDVRRRYSVAGNVAWIAVESSQKVLLLEKLSSGTQFPWRVQSFLGEPVMKDPLSSVFGRLIRSTLDPLGKFV